MKNINLVKHQDFIVFGELLFQGPTTSAFYFALATVLTDLDNSFGHRQVLCTGWLIS